MNAAEDTPFLQRDIRNGMMTVCLARPEQHNALNGLMIEALWAALDAAHSDASVRLVCLRAEGTTFCAGIDLKAAASIAGRSGSEARADVDLLTRTILRLARFPKPVLAVVQGSTFGAGVGLIAASDFVLATPAASIALTQVRFGLIPGLVAPLLAEAIGLRAARQVALSGERVDAQRGLAMGLFTEICEPGAIEERVLSLALALRKGAPAALANTKSMLLPDEQGPLDETRMRRIAETVALQRAGPEARDGMAAFRDRRLPFWVTKEHSE